MSHGATFRQLSALTEPFAQSALLIRIVVLALKTPALISINTSRRQSLPNAPLPSRQRTTCKNTVAVAIEYARPWQPGDPRASLPSCPIALIFSRSLNVALSAKQTSLDGREMNKKRGERTSYTIRLTFRPLRAAIICHLCMFLDVLTSRDPPFSSGRSERERKKNVDETERSRTATTTTKKNVTASSCIYSSKAAAAA